MTLNDIALKIIKQSKVCLKFWFEFHFIENYLHKYKYKS